MTRRTSDGAEHRRRLPNIHNLLKMLFQRVIVVSLLIALQILLVIFLALRGGMASLWLWIGMYVFSLLVALRIITRNTNPAYQVAWLAALLFVPLAGSLLYLMLGGNRQGHRLRGRVAGMRQTLEAGMSQDAQVLAALAAQSEDAAVQARYLSGTAAFPVWQNTQTEYFPSAERCFERMQEELEKAQRYIFVEYFIIEQGHMWQTVLDILTRKAAAGLDVRVIYDDFGCIRRLPYHYRQELERAGIACEVFNPFIPVLSGHLNNRDHRKLMIIDGTAAFTGGLNLADEYININSPYGRWKDAGVLVRGDAAWSMTLMFLSLWEAQRGIREDIEQYRPAPAAVGGQGFVQPYADCPLDGEPVGETVYLGLLNRARHSVRIMTPYLVMNSELTMALTGLAKSGVDVTIITPHIPDKWYVHALSRAHYARLVPSGVKIYEYTPGFIHSKVFLVDGAYATVGTINLDFRSLFLHYENGVWMYRPDCLADIARDFDETLPQCQPITLEECTALPWHKKLQQALLRLLATLM